MIAENPLPARFAWHSFWHTQVMMSDAIQIIGIITLALLNAAMVGVWIKEIWKIWNGERKEAANEKRRGPK